MARIPISVAIPDDTRFARTVAGLRGNGMQVDRVHEVIGVVVGTVDEDGLEALRGLDGVGAVEVQRDVGALGRRGAFTWF